MYIIHITYMTAYSMFTVMNVCVLRKLDLFHLCCVSIENYNIYFQKFLFKHRKVSVVRAHFPSRCAIQLTISVANCSRDETTSPRFRFYWFRSSFSLCVCIRVWLWCERFLCAIFQFECTITIRTVEILHSWFCALW